MKMAEEQRYIVSCALADGEEKGERVVVGSFLNEVADSVVVKFNTDSNSIFCDCKKSIDEMNKFDQRNPRIGQFF